MDVKYRIIFYQNRRGDSPVDEFLDSLEKRPRAKTLKWLALLEEQGPDLPRPYADVVKGPIRELWVSFGRLEIRLLYFFYRRRDIIVTNGFLKKKQAINTTELERVMHCRGDWVKRHGG